MTFWLFGIGLCLLTAFLVALPAFRKSLSGVDREAGALAILKDQLAEVERDTERGLISQEDAQAAVIEIKRRMLGVGKHVSETTGEGAADETRPEANTGRTVIFATALLVPLIGTGIYALTGNPEVKSLPFAERQDERQQQQDVAGLVVQLKERLEADANGGPTEGWTLLGQTYMRMERYQEAAEAYGRVVDRAEATPALWALYAEALLAAESGAVTPRAVAFLDKALAKEPKNIAAVFYKAIATEQEGKAKEARDMLISRMQAAPEPAPWMGRYLQQVNRLGRGLGLAETTIPELIAPTGGPAENKGDPQTASPGPTREDVEAAGDMTDDERDQFIRSMVDRLAERLQETPDDLEGWMRLTQAYQVLGEEAKFEEAKLKALELARKRPENDLLRAQVLERFGP